MCNIQEGHTAPIPTRIQFPMKIALGSIPISFRYRIQKNRTVSVNRPLILIQFLQQMKTSHPKTGTLRYRVKNRQNRVKEEKGHVQRVTKI